ncbi:MAG: 1,4-dihydroxy-2-naphthoate polyprenyltransferase [Verrucomicrobiota bacterium]
MAGWKIWLLAARPKTLPAAAAPVLVGSALAAADAAFGWLPALLCLLFALLIQIGTNFANDYFDFKKGADTPERTGPTRAVASGQVAPETMRRAAYGVLAAGFVVGCGLIPFGGWWLLGVGVAAVLCALAYTAGPLPLAYVGLGDLFVVLFFGLVAVGFTYYVQTGEFSQAAWQAGLGVGLLINNLLVVNNVRDIESDRRANKKTLAVRLGRRFSQVQYRLSGWVAALAAVGLTLQGYSVAVFGAALIAPLNGYLSSALHRARTPEAYGRVLAGTSGLIIVYSLLLGGGLLVQT